MASYTPNMGDIVWLEFDPQAGHEQAGYRPAVVLSPLPYNEKTGLMLCVPLTTKIKGYPFEVAIDGTLPQVALADQIKSLDWQARRAKPKGKVRAEELNRIREMATALING